MREIIIVLWKVKTYFMFYCGFLIVSACVPGTTTPLPTSLLSRRGSDAPKAE